MENVSIDILSEQKCYQAFSYIPTHCSITDALKNPILTNEHQKHLKLTFPVTDTQIPWAHLNHLPNGAWLVQQYLHILPILP